MVPRTGHRVDLPLESCCEIRDLGLESMSHNEYIRKAAKHEGESSLEEGDFFTITLDEGLAARSTQHVMIACAATTPKAGGLSHVCLRQSAYVECMMLYIPY